MNRPRRAPRRWWRGAGRTRRVTVLAMFTLLMLPATAMAFSSIARLWTTQYPTSASYANASCLLCHGTTAGATDTSTWNPYGWAIRSGGATTAAIVDAEGANSDGDPGGASNLAEIQANAQPGWTVGSTNIVYDINGAMTTGVPAPAGIGLIDPVVAPPPTPTPVPPTPTPVPPTPTPTPGPVSAGSVRGSGTLDDPGRSTFELEVRGAGSRAEGSLTVRTGDGRFASRRITSFVVTGSVATMAGSATWNGLAGYTFTATATDARRARSGDDALTDSFAPYALVTGNGTTARDRLSLTVRDRSGAVVRSLDWPVRSGDIAVRTGGSRDSSVTASSQTALLELIARWIGAFTPNVASRWVTMR